MARRYVFWRTPTGKAYKGNDGKHAPTSLLAEIGVSATLNDQGQLSWPGFILHRDENALRATAVVLQPDGRELNETDGWSIVWSAIRSVIKRRGGSTPVKASDAIDEADREAAKHFRKKVTDYVLVASLSINSFPARCMKVRDCQVAPIKTRTARYPYPDVLKQESPETLIGKHIASSKYQLVRVRTSGRTIHEAVDNALDALNLLRGLWNLIGTYRSWSITFGGRARQPLGVIHTGPVHTLHCPGGQLATDVYWYEPNYTGDQALFKPRQGCEGIEKGRRWATRRILRLAYRRDLEDLIIRYAAALDQTDLNVAFLHMWGILERLTDTVGRNYDDTVSRALWPLEDREIGKDMLQSLRLRRNQYVHSGKSPQGQDQIAYMMKWFLDPHLLQLIRNDFGIQSLEEYGRYLSLPTEIEELKRQSKQLQRAVRIRKKWSRSS